MWRAACALISCCSTILGGALSPDKTSNNLNNINDLKLYHLIRESLDGGVIDVNSPCCLEFLDVAGAQRVRHIPAHPHEHDLFGEVGSLKTGRHCRSPSGI